MAQETKEGKKFKGNAWIPNFGRKGWAITLICFVFLFYYSFPTNLANLASIAGWEETYGWTTTDISSAISIAGWISLIAVVLFGALGRKIGAKNLSMIGLAASAVGTFIIGFANTLALFYVGIILYYFAMVAYGSIAVGLFGSSWFPRTKGSFMGIATIGMTLCSAAINPMLMGCIAAGIGATGFFIIMGVIQLVMIFVVWKFAANTPEEVGCYPDNDKSISREELDAELAAAEEYKKNSPWTTAKVLKTPQTWLVGLGTGMPMLGGGGILAVFVATLVGLGHATTVPVALLTSMWPFGLLGHYLIGVIDQKIGSKKTTMVVCCVLGFGGLCGFFFGTHIVGCCIAAACTLFGLSGAANMCMSLTTTIYGRQDFGSAYPVIQVIFSICSFGGAMFMGLVLANFGPAFVFLAVTLVCVVGIVFTALIPNKQIGSQVHGEQAA